MRGEEGGRPAKEGRVQRKRIRKEVRRAVLAGQVGLRRGVSGNIVNQREGERNQGWFLGGVQAVKQPEQCRRRGGSQALTGRTDQ